MSDSIFREGGPYKIRQTEPDKHEFTIPLSPDEDGLMARACPDDQCSPGYFKVRAGTGITGGQVEAFCPYCRRGASPGDFATPEQIRFAKEVMIREAHEGIERLLINSLQLDGSGRRKLGGGLLSIEMQLKPGSKPTPRRPIEESIRRDVVCPHCGLDQSVFGLATWCADCGQDIFLSHVRAEFAVLERMIVDVPRRREILGPRVAARDIENALEDVVSLFEAVLRTLAKRALHGRGMAVEETEKRFKKLGSGLQNVDVANRFFFEEFGIQGFGGAAVTDIEVLREVFAKRHPITHNLGVVDRKYLERARSFEQEAKEITVSEEEITTSIRLSVQFFELLYRQLFSSNSPLPQP